MEQKSNKIQIPKKIKITAWVLVGSALSQLLFNTWLLMTFYREIFFSTLLSQLWMLLPFSLLVFPACLILNNRREGWSFGVIYLFYAVGSDIINQPWHGHYIFGFIIMAFTFINFLILLKLLINRKIFINSANNSGISISAEIAIIGASLLGLYNLLTWPYLDLSFFVLTNHYYIDWAMFIVGGFLFLISLIVFFSKNHGRQIRWVLLFLLPLMFIACLANDVIVQLPHYYPGAIASLIFFVFLLVDRKNYFAAVERRRKMNKIKMEETQNKIRIPKKTKIASVIAIISCLVALVILITVTIANKDFGFYHNFTVNWYVWVFILGYCFVAFSLLRGYKIGWYIGLVIFGVAFFFLTKFACQALSATDVFDLRKENTFGAIINMCALVLLLVDRKNYFAAVEKAKNIKN